MADRARARARRRGRSTSAPASPTSRSARGRSGRRTTSTGPSSRIDPAHERRDEDPDRRRAGARGRCGLGLGQHGRRGEGGRAAGLRLRRGRGGRPRARRHDRVGPAAPGQRRGRDRARWRTPSAWCCGGTGTARVAHTVGYRSCDDSTAQTGDFENRRCAANANAYARAERLVAVIGPYNSPCAGVEIPILNRAPGGPLAMISPSNTYPGLTRGGPGLQAGAATGASRTCTTRPAPATTSGCVPATISRAPRSPCWRSGSGSRASSCSTTAADSGRACVSDPFRNAAGKLRRPARRLGDLRPAPPRATPRSRTASRARGRRAS